MITRQLRSKSAIQLIGGLLLASVMPAGASAAVSASLSQCGNLANGAPTDCSWQNGNLNPNQAHWLEGDSVPYQLVMSGLTPNTSYTVTIGYDTTKSGKHAIDYLTSYNRTMAGGAPSLAPTNGTANPCSGVTGCTTPPSTFAIPQDPNVTSAGVTPVSGSFALFNGTITAASSYSVSGSYTSDSQTNITLTFTSGPANASGKTNVVLAWAGHIATRADWGQNSGAVNISGSPYHTLLVSFSGGGGGSQDRALTASAVIFPATITITKAAIPIGNTSFPFTISPGLPVGTSLVSNLSLVNSGSGSNSVTYTLITSSAFNVAYAFTESAVGGWSLIGLSCTVDSVSGSTASTSASTATVTPKEAGVVSCTYTNSEPTVASPSFSPGGGSYGSVQTVTISTATQGASIRYTTDGSIPSETAGILYTGAVTISTSKTLKAIAYEGGMIDSAVSSASYTLNLPAVATPTFNPGAGTYSGTQSVTIGTTTQGASIRYTTDGSTPSETAGTPYTSPVVVTSTSTLKAMAYEIGMTDSGVASAIYTLPISVTVSPSAVILYSNQTQQFTATVTNTANTAVNWTINPSIGTISTSGLYTAPSSITTQQTITVTATSQADNTKSATATITLSPPISVSVTPTTSTLYGGGTQQFAANVVNTGNTAVTWTISPAGVGTISSSGLYTAPASVTTQQTVTVIATSQADTSVSASAAISLYPPVAVGLSPTTASLNGGGTQQFSASVSNTSNMAVTWTISPAGVGTISSSGLYTAPATIGAQQTVTITATSQADATASAAATITLTPAQCTSNGHRYVRIITIDHAKVPHLDQVNFPFLFSAVDQAFRTTSNGGHVTNSNGYDIIFTSDAAGMNPLPFEQESYSSSTGALIYWINVPLVSHISDAVIYMWYGNSNITTSQANASGVWSTGYEGVYHLSNGTTLSATDSTANGDTGSITGVTATTGKIDGGASFGNPGYITLPSLPNYAAADFTISTWVKFSSLPAYNVIMVGKSQASNVLFISTQWDGEGLRMGRTGVEEVASARFIWSTNTWYYVALTRKNGSSTFYVNGTALGTNNYAPDATYDYPNSSNDIGGDGGSYPFYGSLDEFRILNTARSADWIATEYNNQNSPSTFYTVLSENAVSVAPSTASLYAAWNLQFTAIPLGTCTGAVSWSISPAGLGTITSTGLYTAPSNVTLQQTVTVTATDDTGTLSPGIASVTLFPAPRNSTLAIVASAQPPYVTGATQQFAATLKNQDGTPISGATVSFNVTGVNPGSGGGTTDGDGVATFTYTGIHSGNDTIQASASIVGIQVISNKVSATWLVPAQQISTTIITGEFFLSDGSSVFDTLPNATPAFTEEFPGVNFNPPSGAVPGTPSNIGVGTRPFTDVTTDLSGNFTGTIIAQGNGYQAGIGPMGAFQAVFRGSFTVASAGNVAFNFYTDDGFILGIANGATRVSGANTNMPTVTPFAQFPTMGALNSPNAASGNQVVVYFPSAGTYPFELDYTECCGGGLTLTMTQGATSPTGVAPAGSLTLSPNSVSPLPVGGQQTFTVFASDASGAPVPNLSIGMEVIGIGGQELSGTTDATGHATIVYRDVDPGTTSVQAVAFISGMVTYSNVVSVPWTLPASTTTASGSSGTLNISISAQNTVTLPNTLQLNGAVTDSTLPSGGTISVAWSQVSGPGTATFASPQQTSTTASFSQPGSYVLQLGASDADASGSAQFTVTVNPAPGITQGWIGSPASGSAISGVVPISVAPGVTLQSGTLSYYPNNNFNNVIVLNANTTGAGQIGTLDTTLFSNGSYWIQLQATDSTGHSQYSLALVTVVGDYKPGRVTSTVTDLIVPSTGLAINIQRTYDSLNATKSSDFGYGWSLGTTVDLKVSDRGDVTFTLNGVRRTFYLTPQYGGWFLPYYLATFTPEPGFHGTLTDAGPGCPDLFDFLVPDGSLWACIGGGIYDPPGYIYTDPSGTSYTISANGNLQSVIDKNGNGLTITPSGISSSTGLSVPFVRDSNGRITKITDPKGNQYLYSYDTAGNLMSVQYPGISQPSTYTYNANHFYAGGTDARGNPLATTNYYPDGRLQSVSDALGKTTSYAYNLATQTTIVTYPPDASGATGTATLAYDSYGMLLSSTDPLGHTITNGYDSNHNLISVTDPLGHTNSYTYDANGNKTSSTYPQVTSGANRTSTTTYNEFAEPTSTTDELGNVRTFNYDTNYHNPLSVTDTINGAPATLASFIFNDDGTLQAGAIGYDISANPSKASQFTYDSNGNMTSRTDALGRTTSYTYDSLGHKITMTMPLPSSSTNPATATTNYTYDALGNLTQTAAPLGRTTSSTYDGNGNKISDTDALGHIATYEYDALNRLTKTTYPTQPSTTTTRTYDFRNNVVDETDQAGHIAHHVYDLAGRLTSLTKAYGTSNASTTTYAYYNDGRKQSETDALGHTTTYTYDPAGRLTALAGVKGNVSYGYDAAGNRISSTDGDGNTTQYQYDARKRLTKTIYPDATSVTNGYDGPGNLTSVKDQAGNTVQYTFDAANQLQSVIQVNSPNSSNNTTAYGYDKDGNLTNLTDANGHSTVNAFDLLFNLTTKTLPDGSLTETRTYDTVGNLFSLQHFNGKTTTYAYDPLNRLLTRTPDSSYGEPVVSFTYTATGKRDSMTDASGTTSYTYDSLDRPTAKATPEGTLNYTYDAASNVASLSSSNANGVSVGYTYDSLNRLSTVVDNRLGSGQNTTTYTYDTASNVATATYPNNLQSTFHYDQLNRLTALTTPNSGYLYQLGPTGNRTNATELTGRTLNWSYDGIYRLTSEAVSLDPDGKNGAVGYGLDPVGNRLSANSTLSGVSSGSYSYNLNDLLSIENYDSNGNTLTTGGKVFTYDSENRLKSMNGGAVMLLYDGDGNRVAKTVGGVTTRYLVDDLNPTGYVQVMEEIVNGAVQRVYTYGLQRIGQNQIVNNAWTPSFYGYDGGGSVRQLTNPAGVITDKYDYDAFGNFLNSTGTTPNNYLYRGEQFDPDLGLYYLRARYYNPATGRFMSRDPEDGDITNPATLHKYMYAGGDPVNAFDPSGRNTATWPGAPPQSTSPTRSAIEYLAIVGTISLGVVEGVKTLGCAVNIAETVNALRTPSGSFAGIKVDVPDCSANKDCTPYEEAIQTAMEEVEIRYNQLLLDVHYLYEYACKNPKNPWTDWGSWDTHIETYLDAQAVLIGAIAAAKNAGCPVSAEAEYWATKPPPTANARCGGQ